MRWCLSSESEAEAGAGAVVVPHRILFVCTANICRSPMGEAFAIEYGRERSWAIEARSCGVNALPGNEAAPRSVRAMKEVGIDLRGHRSSPLDSEHIAWATHILVMEIRHATRVHERFPEADGRVLLLGTFGGVMEIEDPYGSWFMRSYRRSRDEIQQCVRTFIDRLPPRPVAVAPAELEGSGMG